LQHRSLTRTDTPPRSSVAANAKIPFHHPEEKGTVLMGPITPASGKLFYLVALDVDRFSRPSTIVKANEIEPDI
jgi:hypothetical protein